MQSRISVSMLFGAGCLFLAAVLVTFGPLPVPTTAAAAPKAQAVPLFFVPNRGQAPPEVRFTLRAPELAAAFTDSTIRFHTRHGEITVRFQGVNPASRVETGDPLPARVHYFTGDQPGGWRTGVAASDTIVYRQLYPGIDLVYAVEGITLKSEFRLRAGADPQWIRWRYEGGGEARVDAGGSLVVQANGGEIREEPVRAYQEDSGRQRPVEGGYRALAGGWFGFHVGAYDRGLPLVIDPALSYSTYLGGAGLDSVRALAVDAAGNAYLAGYTDSVNFPLAGALQPTNNGGVEAFVAKVNPSGTALVYCTYLGGGWDDRAFGLAVDAAGSAYLTGWTYSPDFPTTSGAFQRTFGGGRDAFVAKLAPDGSALVYSTYLGSSDQEEGNAIAVDAAGNAFVTGDTYSAGFPVVGALQSTLGGRQDAFVSKLNPAGSALVYSTFLGGAGDERANALALDATGNAYLAGATTSTNFPVYQALQPSIGGGQDAFVTKLASSGAALIFSTYLGGSGGSVTANESAAGIQVDSQGGVYVAGTTPSANFPLAAPFRSSFGGGGLDAFVAKLVPAGTALQYSTYLGGASLDYAIGVNLTPSGAAVVGGYTSSPNFPLAGALQAVKSGGYDGFMTRLNPLGSGLELSTYWGGGNSEATNAVAVGPSGDIWIAGQTQSTDYPVRNALQAQNLGAYSGFLTKFSYSAPTAVHRGTYGTTRLISYGSSTVADAGGNITSDPGVWQNAAGDTYVVGRNDSTRVYMNIFRAATQSWNGWMLVGDQKQGNPAVAALPNGDAYVVARDSNYNYWLNRYLVAGGFQGWQYLGGATASDPSVALAGNGTLYVVGRRSTGALVIGRYVPGSGFLGWMPTGSGAPVATGKPAVVVGSDGAAYVAVRASDLGLWLARVQGDVWGPWYNGQGQLGADPDLAARGGVIYAGVVGPTGYVYVRPFVEGSGSGWQNWINANGQLERVAIASGAERFYLAGKTVGNFLWWYASGIGWTNVGSAGSGSGNLSAGPK